MRRMVFYALVALAGCAVGAAVVYNVTFLPTVIHHGGIF